MEIAEPLIDHKLAVLKLTRARLMLQIQSKPEDFEGKIEVDMELLRKAWRVLGMAENTIGGLKKDILIHNLTCDK